MGVAIAIGRAKANAAIVAGAVVLWIVMSLVTGQIDVNRGLGFEGAGFDGMVRGFTLKGGDEPTRVSPLFPALAWIPYIVLGDVATSFKVVDAVSIAVLVLAACMLIDDRRGDARWKLFVAASLTMAIAFGKIGAFVPGSAALCALAAIMLAIALSSRDRPGLTAAAHVAAVMALPVGLVAPLYGSVRAVRLHVRASRIALMFLPAVLMWLFVQWWARGGIPGVLEDFGPHKLFGDVDIWTQPLFLAFALYFLATASGGLSLIAFAHPAALGRMARRAPEAVVLAAAVIVYAIVSGGAAPLAFGFLAPVWVFLCVEWSELIPRRYAWGWFAAGLLLTVVTQHPFAHVDVTSYFVDWHPYDVYRGSASIRYDQLWERWIPPFIVVGLAMWAMAIPNARGAASIGGFVESPWPAGTSGDMPAATRSVPVAAPAAERTIPLTPGRRWNRISYGYACLLAVLTGYFFFQIPIQLSDSFGNLLQVQDASLGELVRGQFNEQAYLRPALWVGLKIAFDLASGHYFLWFRAIHAMLLLGVFVSVLAVIRVRTAADLVAASICLAIVIGLHTFAGTIREAFPINTFLIVALCFTATIAIARVKNPRPWLDLIPAALLTYATFAVETGLLIWVVCVAAYVSGFRGISRRAVLLATAIVAAYFVLRFGVLHTGTPGLAERSTGFGFTTLEPSELIARFGRNPYPLYAYNVLSGISTVLFGDPRGGVWLFLAGVSRGDVPPWVVINVLTSSLTTILIGAYVVRRRRAWLAWDLDDGDRLVLIFLAVLPANAAISYAYAKDVVMSPAGICYALAAFVAFRDLITVPPGVTRRRTRVVASALLVLSVGWSIRLVGIEYNLRAVAASVRTEWAFEDEWEATNHITIRTPQQMALRQQLYDDAIWRRVAPRQISLRWPARLFDTIQ